jgi:chaperonin GroES
MNLTLDYQNFDKFIMIGDKVLIKPKSPQEKTKSGLFLPPGFEEKQRIQSGYVVKAGPGFPVPFVAEQDETWKESADDPKYVALQAKAGDLAVYMQDSSFHIEFKKEKYVIVPHSAILLLIRDEGLFE